MGWEDDLALLALARRQLAQVLDLDGTDNEPLEIACYLGNQIPISRAWIAVICSRTEAWVSAAILRVEARMRHEPSFAAEVDRLAAALRRALRSGPRA